MTLLLTATVVIILALAAETLILLAREFLPEIYGEAVIHVAIKQTQTDLQESRKKIDTVATAAKAVRQELARAKQAIADIEQEFETRKKVDPVLVFAIGRPGYLAEGARRCFRASLSKKLGPTAEPYQKQ